MAIECTDKKKDVWRIRLRWDGYPPVILTIGKQKDARRYHDALERLKRAGRRDLIQLIHDRPEALTHLPRLLDDQGSAGIQEHHLLPPKVEAPPPPPTLGACYDAWRVWMQRQGTISRQGRGYSTGTLAGYQASLNHLWRFLADKPASGSGLGRETPVTWLDRDNLEAFREWRTAEGRSPATVNNDANAVQSLSTWIRRQRKDSPHRWPLPAFSLPSLPVPGEDEAKSLTDDEVARVRVACDARTWPLFAVSLRTGLRIGEVQGLRRVDVRLADREIDVREYPGHRLKTPSSRRTVPIPPDLVTVLEAELALVWPDRQLWDPQLRQYGYVQYRWERAARLAGVKGTIHGLRHTYGSRLADSGIAPRDIAEIMGHSNVATTEIYWGASDKAARRREALRRLAAFEGTATDSATIPGGAILPESETGAVGAPESTPGRQGDEAA